MSDALPKHDEPVGEDELTEALAGELADNPDMARNIIKRLSTERDDLLSELEEVRAERDEFEVELEDRDADAFNVLRAVRDWFDNVILLGRPMQDPRAVWKQVERALE